MDNETLLISILVIAPIVLFFILQLARLTGGKVDKQVVSRQWARVKQLANSNEPQFAIIEADKVFDSVLKQLGFKGASMGERLKSAQPSIKNINGVWTAHKLRNQLVHDTDFKLKAADVKSALAHFEKALKGLGAL